MDTTISFRVDTKLKEEARKTATEMGLDLSTVVKSSLLNLVKHKKIDFNAETPSAFFISSLKEAKKDIAEGRVSPTFEDADEAIAWLDNPNRKYVKDRES